jgi:hypothetical protein
LPSEPLVVAAMAVPSTCCRTPPKRAHRTSCRSVT